MFLNYKAISFIRGMGANHYLSDIIKNKVKRKTKLPFLSCIKYNYYIDIGSNITNKIILQKWNISFAVISLLSYLTCLIKRLYKFINSGISSADRKV